MPKALHQSAMHVRRLTALALVAWLNLAMQPCLAAVRHAGAPAGMEHCHHAGDCPEMRAADCATDNLLGLDNGRGAGSTPPPLLSLLPVDPLGQAATRMAAQTARPPSTGPPLTIRFCNLRN